MVRSRWIALVAPGIATVAMFAVASGCGSAPETAKQETEPARDVVINYPAKAPANWPLFMAKEGDYYRHYGLNPELQFGVSPAGIAAVVSGQAVMTNYSLEQAMQAASQAEGKLKIVGSPMNSGLFALMAKPEIKGVKDLKGKKIGVSQIGDAPYLFTSAILDKYGLTQRDVTWVPIGTEGGGRVAALASGRIDASMIPPPAYFKLEQQGFHEIDNLANYKDLYSPMAYLISEDAIKADPMLPQRLIKAQAEGIKRYYDDKAFAMQAYAKYDPVGDAKDIERIYDHDRADNTYERVPYVLAPAVEYIIAHQVDPQVGERLRNFDFKTAIDNSYVQDLVDQGFFRTLFGEGVAAEEQRKAAIAFH